MSTVARKILFNTVAQVIGRGFTAVFSVIIVKIITNYLGVAGYGDYTAIYEFISFFAIASDLGLYTIAVREMAKNPVKTQMIVGNVLTVRTLVSAFTMFLAVVLSFFYASPETTIVFPLAVAITGLSTIFALQTVAVSTVLQVNLKMQYNSLGSVFGKILTLVSIVSVVFLIHPSTPEQGFYLLLVAGIVGNLGMLLMTYGFARKYTNIRFRIDWDFLKNVVWKALPYGLALVLNVLYFRIGSMLLYRIAGPEQAGIYGVPMRMLEAVAIVPQYFMNSVLPILTRTLEEKNKRYQQIIQYSFDFLVMTGVSIAVGTAVLAYPIVAIVSSPEFLSRVNEGFFGSDMSLQILIFALAFSFINTLFGFTLVAINKQSKLLIINGSGALIAIVLNLLLIPQFGSRGSAMSSIVVEFFIALAAYLYAKKYLDFKLNFVPALKILFSGAVMGAVLLALRDPLFHFMGLENKSLILLIPLGASVFIGLLVFTKVITKDMVQTILKRNKVVTEEIEPPVV